MIFRNPPEVIGHRGSGSSTGSSSVSGTTGNGTGSEGVNGPRENTPASFRAAIADGATWVELDVRRSADDVLLLHHDPALADGRVIVDLPAEVSRAAGVATLAEALAAIRTDVGVDVDVKTVMEDATAPEERRTSTLLMPVLEAEIRRRPLFVCSFDPAALLDTRRALPQVPLAWMPYVRNPLDSAVAAAAGMECAAVCVDARSFGTAGEEDPPLGRRTVGYTVELAHRAGLEVVCWCPVPKDAARFTKEGVDAVVVNDVPGVVAALAAGEG